MTGWRILAVTCAGPAPTALDAAHRPLLLVFPADASGEALAGAFAAEHDAAVLGRVSDIRREGQTLFVSRSTHGGRLALDLKVTPCLAVATANDPQGVDGTITLGAPETLPVERTSLEQASVSLEAAKVVIGGGRGLDPDSFAALERIAAAVGGAVAASLPAVDLGLAPVARQVGQSGKFVNPAIYFAAGMSGTPQHFAGVGARARIVALNTDAHAPIFGFAHAGAVADAREVLPLVAAALEAKRETHA
jgi:electron transfer flavoprotein alpha subunit